MIFTDQMQRPVQLAQWPPRRIVSLVPSQTELLADLGLDQQVVGITKFCIHPAEWFRQKPRVGGTKTLNFAKIEALQPDLLLGNKEENDREQIEWLAARYPVWMSDIARLNDALDMIGQVGQLTGRQVQADGMVAQLKKAFTPPAQSPGPRVAYLIWRKPYMAAGGDTFIHDMLHWAGYTNVFQHLSRYPEITLDSLAVAQPDCVFLSSEPYPFAEKHLLDIQNACPAAKVCLVDGEMFSWYGSRLLHAPDYFQILKSNLI